MKQRYKRQPAQLLNASEPFFKPKVQTKLKMGKAGDKYEVEADKMADKVVSNSGKTDTSVQKMGNEEEVQQKPLATEVTSIQKMEEEEPVQAMSEEEGGQKMEEEEPLQAKKEEESIQKMEEKEPVQAKKEEEGIQKMEEEEPVQGKAEEPVQTKCEECANQEKAQMKDEEEVQTKSRKSNTPSTKTENSLKSSIGGGQKMDTKTRSQMEQGFGADFSHINIHTDTNALKMSKDMNAQAFTYGNDIFFNSGKYDPDSSKGKHLLAHELTHTIQQKGMVQKKVQRKPLYKGEIVKKDINPLDPTTAPAGNSSAPGHAAFIINASDFKNFCNKNGPEATMNMVFPLPEVSKSWGKCTITSRDINVQGYTKIRIIIPAPWKKTMKKSEAAKLLSGDLVPHLKNVSDPVTIVFRGKNGDQTFIANDLKAEKQHAIDNKCIFKKHIEKYQKDVDALKKEFDSGYLGLGWCTSRLEEMLNRKSRIQALIKDYKNFGDFYDGPSGSHFARTDISKSVDKKTVYIDMILSKLPNAKRKC